MISYDFQNFILVDDGEDGASFFSKDTKDKIMFINQGSELAILQYLQQKYPQGNDSDNVLPGFKGIKLKEK